MYISENIRILRDGIRWSQEKVASYLGIKRTAYQAYEDGRNAPPAETLTSLGKLYRLPIDVLLNDRVSSIEYKKQENRLEIVTNNGNSFSTDEYYPDSKDEDVRLGRLKSSGATENISSWQGIPIFDTAVSAGMLSLIRDEKFREPSYYLPIPGFKDCSFGARVNGDSMYPEIRSGDFIICKEVTDFIFGDIYLVVTKDGQETVKRIFPNDNSDYINLVPSNREMPVTPMLKNNIVKIYKVKGVIKGY